MSFNETCSENFVCELRIDLGDSPGLAILKGANSKNTTIPYCDCCCGGVGGVSGTNKSGGINHAIRASGGG